MEFFYRNVLGKSIQGSLPNAFTFENIEVYDKNGTPVDVVTNQDLEIVAGWMVEYFGEQPTSRKGQPIVLAPKSKVPITSNGCSTLIVEPGQKYRVRFSVRNYADNAKGNLPTGEIEFEVKDEEAKSGVGKSSDKGAKVTPNKKGVIVTKNANLTVSTESLYKDLVEEISRLKESGIADIRIEAAE